MSAKKFRRLPRRRLRGVWVAFASLFGVAPLAMSQPIADGFVSGAGKYSTGALNNQNPFAPGFTSGWTQGTGSTKFHVDPAANGLSTSAGLSYPTGGSVGVTGATADAAQTIGRSVSVPSSSTYYMSGIYVRGNASSITPGAYAFMGWGNTVVPNAVTSGSSLQGVYVGFTQTAETSTDGTTLDDFGDLIIRSRQNIGGTLRTVDTVLVDGQAVSTYLQNYYVVTKLTVNASGTTDRLDYWVNPTSIASDAAMSSSALTSGSVSVDTIASASDLSRLTFAESAYDALFSFDEPRIATTLADLSAATPTPEPVELALAVVGLLALGRRSRRSPI